GVIAWLGSLGVHEATSFVSVPENREFEMAARTCVPVRFNEILLGFLWLIDEPEMSSAQLEKANGYAEEIAIALYRARLLEHAERERELSLMAEVVGRADGDPRKAGEQLVAEGHLAAMPIYVAMVMRGVGSTFGEAPDAVRVLLADAAEQVRRSVSPHHMSTLPDGEQVFLVLAADTGEEVNRRALALSDAVRAAAPREGWDGVVGVGEAVVRSRDLAVSCAQAGRAIRAAVALGREEPIVHWSELGAYKAILELSGENERELPVADSLQRLLDSNDAATLVPTLECYLDLAGDASASAAALYIHRSSLYGRLRRIEELTGVDLRSGEDRLELHLGIRLLRLAGRIRS
ncbi:MAG TPA: helix-turn-helix domain-containing protein, partial [Solirubrobacterales bacterium]|nr:helix-turn-helix domain-containing protein [Solirubrobacterales bacterium]